MDARELQLSVETLRESLIWVGFMENGRAKSLKPDEMVYLQRLNIRVGTPELTRYNFSVAKEERDALLAFVLEDGR